MNDPRQVLRTALRGQGGLRPPFLPRLNAVASRVSQKSPWELWGNPAGLTNAWRDAWKLLGCDGIVFPFDDTLEAEALGCAITWPDDGSPFVRPRHAGEVPGLAALPGTGRLAVAKETLARLIQLVGRETCVVASLTGPFTLAGYLSGNALLSRLEGEEAGAGAMLEVAAQAVGKMLRAYGEMGGLGGFVIQERVLPPPGSGAEGLLVAIYRTLRNITGYYRLPAVLYLSQATPEMLPLVGALPLEGGVLPPEFRSAWRETARHAAMGLCLPTVAFLEEDMSFLEDVSSDPSPGVFFTSYLELPAGADLGRLVAAARKVMGKKDLVGIGK